jgi:hypothetical protein
MYVMRDGTAAPYFYNLPILDEQFHGVERRMMSVNPYYVIEYRWVKGKCVAAAKREW